ncbi:hypothetical protein [Streptomyces sp. NPDC048603]|uniref:hypothetical protein n=1 Tax=Streptomyces sp. NPDC048603 TaxID=3365577 RepID=UPI00371E7AF1
MRTALLALRATGAAAALTAVSVFAGPAALAEEGNRGTVWATPTTAEPGAQVELRVLGCDGGKGVAKSPVFVSPVPLHGRGGHGGRSVYGGELFGEAMISSHAKPGWHTIEAHCEGGAGRATGSIQVVPHRGGGHDKPDHDKPDHGKPDHDRPPYAHHTPRWPVHAGGGGMAGKLPGAEQLPAAGKPAGNPAAENLAAAKKHPAPQGPGLPHTLIGAFLAAAATLAVAGRALKLRRRRSGE